jgi:hypothetical protein
VKADAIASLDGRRVVGIDEHGVRYFKRLRCHDAIVVPERLKPDGLTAAQVLCLESRKHATSSEFSSTTRMEVVR